MANDDPLASGTIDYPPLPNTPPQGYIDWTAGGQLGPQPDPGQVVFDFSTLSFITPYMAGSSTITDDGALLDNVDPAPIPSSTNFVPSIFSDNQNSANFYNKYRILTRYITDDGRRSQAVCGPAGTPPETVRVHGGRTRKIIAWIAERFGTWPVLPGPDTGIQGETLRGRQIDADTPFPQLDGTLCLYRVKGVYVYDCSYVLSSLDPLSAGKTDAVTTPATENVVQYGSFDNTLLQGLQPSGPFGPIAS